MKKQHISSDIKRRAAFFNYCFDKGLKSVGVYKSMTAMVFEKKQPETTVYHQHDVHSQLVNTHHNITKNETLVQNIHNLSVNNTQENSLTTETSFPQIQPFQSVSPKDESMQQSTGVHHKLDLFTSTVQKRFQVLNQHKQSSRENKRVSLSQRMSIPMSNIAEHTHVEIHEDQHREVEHPSPTNTMQVERFKALEERLLKRIDAKMNVNKNEQKRNNVRDEERIVLQREEKKMVDKVYTLVMKRRDKELKRKGYLYG